MDATEALRTLDIDKSCGRRAVGQQYVRLKMRNFDNDELCGKYEEAYRYLMDTLPKAASKEAADTVSKPSTNTSVTASAETVTVTENTPKRKYDDDKVKKAAIIILIAGVAVALTMRIVAGILLG